MILPKCYGTNEYSEKNSICWGCDFKLGCKIERERKK